MLNNKPLSAAASRDRRARQSNMVFALCRLSRQMTAQSAYSSGSRLTTHQKLTSDQKMTKALTRRATLL